MTRVIVFEGGEGISEENIYECEWVQEKIITLLSSLYTSIADNRLVDMSVGDPIPLQDTFSFVENTMAQIVADEVDGGMIYIIRLP